MNSKFILNLTNISEICFKYAEANKKLVLKKNKLETSSLK